MASTRHRRPIRPAALLAACALASLGIAACGGSSSKDAAASSTGTTSTTSTSSGPAAAGPARFAALRTCLQKEGITLPQSAAGQRPPAGGTGAPRGGFLGGGGFERRLPKGVSAGKLQAALKKCGGLQGGGFRRSGHFLSSASERKALTAFAACMRENGVKLPAPNTSGQGPVFDTKGINTAGTQFKSAEAKCRAKLPGPFAGRGGAPPPQPNGA